MIKLYTKLIYYILISTTTKPPQKTSSLQFLQMFSCPQSELDIMPLCLFLSSLEKFWICSTYSIHQNSEIKTFNQKIVCTTYLFWRNYQPWNKTNVCSTYFISEEMLPPSTSKSKSRMFHILILEEVFQQRIATTYGWTHGRFGRIQP